MTGRKGGQSASILNRSTVNCVKDGLRTSTVSVYAGDLASESGRNISKKLSKVRRKERNARNLPVGVAQNVGPEQEVGICGAPSVVDRDTQDEILAEKDESDWEDIEEHGNGRFGINPKDCNGSAEVIVVEQVEEKTGGKRGRRSFTQEDREYCRLIHRCHLLCMLGRGLLFDAAADMVEVQSLLISCMPPSIFQRVEQEKVMTTVILQDIVKFFYERFKPENAKSDSVLQYDYGRANLLSMLEDKLVRSSGTIEELVTLFAAVIRGMGHEARTVRNLVPSPLKPADVVRQAKQSSKRAKQTKSKVAKEDAILEESSTKIASLDSTKTVSSAHSDLSKCKETGGRKRKCDEELDRELALAMEATSWVAPHQDSQTAAGDTQAREKQGKQKGVVIGNVIEGLGQFWVEVFCGDAKSGRWVTCDPVSCWVDRASDIEGMAPRDQPLIYVTAFNAGCIKDVTQRYSSNFLSTCKKRDQEWWHVTMNAVRKCLLLHKAMQPSRRAIFHDTELRKLADIRETEELEERATRERAGLPTTIEGFKHHEQFVLKRHIGKYQVLAPGSQPVGMHKGEPYYLKSNLSEVHTAERWKRVGREVKQEELGRPVKQIKKRGARPADNLLPDHEIEEEDRLLLPEALMSNFYGEWQTIPWRPPPASNGKVPKNERGNVEVPPFVEELPQGTVSRMMSSHQAYAIFNFMLARTNHNDTVICLLQVHVQLPHIAKICRKLGVDFAPALAGFEIRAGRSVPVIDGVVVCQEFETLIRDAYHQDMQHKAEEARRKRIQEGEAAWHSMLRAMLTRLHLQESYAAATEETLLNDSLSKMKRNDRGRASPSDDVSLQKPKTVVEELTDDQLDMEEI